MRVRLALLLAFAVILFEVMAEPSKVKKGQSRHRKDRKRPSMKCPCGVAKRGRVKQKHIEGENVKDKALREIKCSKSFSVKNSYYITSVR